MQNHDRFHRLFSLPIQLMVTCMLTISMILPGAALPADVTKTSIKVAYPNDNPPFYFTNHQGTADGMIIDIWKLWSRKTGVTVEFLASAWNDTLNDVKQGRVDAHAGLFFSEDRDRFLDFGPPMVETSTHLFYDNHLPRPDGLHDFSAYKIGLIRGDLSRHFLSSHLPEAPIEEFDTYQDLMEAAKQGHIRVFASDTPTARHHLGQLGLLRQFNYDAGRPLYTNAFFPAVRQGNTPVNNLIKQGFSKIFPSEIRHISRLWMSKGTQDKDALIIAIDRDYPPLTLVDSEGNPGGLLVELWQLWSQKTGMAVKFRPFSWKQSIDAVLKGDADIHSGLFKDLATGRWFSFSKPIHRALVALFVNRSQKKLSFGELIGKRVGVVAGSQQGNYIKNKHPGIQPVFYENGEALIRALIKNQVDAIFHVTMAVDADLDRMGIAGKLASCSDSVIDFSIYAGVPGEKQDLIPIINEGFDLLSESVLDDLEKKWIHRPENRFYGRNKAKINFTQEEKNYIAVHTPVVFSEVDWSPLSIISDSGDFNGMIADYLDLITRRSGLTFKFVMSNNWADVLEKYRLGKIDAVPALGKEDEPGRPVALSRPFVSFPLVIVTRDDARPVRNTSDLNHRKVAVGRGFTSFHFLSRHYPDIELVQTPDVKSGLIQLANGKVSAFVGHMAVVIDTIQKNGLTSLKVAGETEFTFEHCIGLDPEKPLALSIINKVLSGMTEQEHQQIRNKWLSVHYEKGIDYGLIAKIVGAAVLLIVVFLYWNLRLSREIAERKRTALQLTESEKKMRAMSEAIHDGLIMIDGKARVVYCNRAVSDLSGIPVEEMLGQDLHKLFIPEAHWERARAGLEQFARTGQGPVVGKLQEVEAARCDGTLFPAEVGVSSFQIGGDWYAVGIIRDISERNRSQEMLENIKNELQHIFDNAQVGILFLKEERRLNRCNTRAAAILGFDSPKEMVGLSMADVHLDNERFVHFGREYGPRLVRGEQVQTEYQFKRRDGTGIWCSLTGKALDPARPPDMEKGIIWAFDDITEKRRAQKALKDSEKRISTIFNSISTGIMVIDAEDFIISDVNPAAAAMIGLPAGDIVGHKCWGFVCPKESGACQAQGEEHEFVNVEKVLLTARGKQIPVLKTVVRVTLGQRTRLLESFVDISAQKRAEKELQKNLADLEKFYQLTIGREEKMIDLKSEVNQLLVQTGQEKKYKIR